MIPTLSKPQLEVMRHGVGSRTAVIATGAIRSGKTVAQSMGFALWSLKQGVGFDHALLGQNVETAMRNVGFDLIKFYQDLGVDAQFNRSVGTRICFRYGGRENNIWVLGASDDRSRRRIQGSTLKGLLVDECTNIPEETFYMAYSRLSVPGSKFYGTTNPEGPNHWFKKKVIDKLPAFNGYEVQMGLDDNPGLDAAVKDRYRASFTGHFKKRYIEGLWAGASGLIYPTWYGDSVGHSLDVRPTVSIDFALSSVFVALLFRPAGRGWVATNEYVYDARDNKTRTETEHADALIQWLRIHYSGSIHGITVYVDPATPNSFKRILRKHGFRVLHADNDVVPGIVTTATRLENSDITIGDCPELREELATYAWDENAQERGEDAPIKENDHAVDALRYFAHSTGKIYRSIGNLTVARAIQWH